MIRHWLIIFGFWCIRLGGGICLVLPVDLMPLARLVVKEVERQAFRNGEQKRHAALIAMLNHHPNREHECAIAIEAAVSENR